MNLPFQNCVQTPCEMITSYIKCSSVNLPYPFETVISKSDLLFAFTSTQNPYNCCPRQKSLWQMSHKPMTKSQSRYYLHIAFEFLIGSTLLLSKKSLLSCSSANAVAAFLRRVWQMIHAPMVESQLWYYSTALGLLQVLLLSKKSP